MKPLNPSTLALSFLITACGPLVIDVNIGGGESSGGSALTGGLEGTDTEGASGVLDGTGGSSGTDSSSGEASSVGDESGNTGGPDCMPVGDYLSCNPACDQPCEDETLQCMGPAGREICTTPCTTPDASSCPPTGFQEPWDVAWCATGFCAIPCDIDALCPNPNVYHCGEGPDESCWPDLRCSIDAEGICYCGSTPADEVWCA